MGFGRWSVSVPSRRTWTVSREEVMYRPRMGLDHPINRVFSYASLLFFVVSTFWWKRTIFETVWPAMNRLLVGLTEARTLSCSTCRRRTA